jgi:hypothetical protein
VLTTPPASPSSSSLPIRTPPAGAVNVGLPTGTDVLLRCSISSSYYVQQFV